MSNRKSYIMLLVEEITHRYIIYRHLCRLLWRFTGVLFRIAKWSSQKVFRDSCYADILVTDVKSDKTITKEL